MANNKKDIQQLEKKIRELEKLHARCDHDVVEEQKSKIMMQLILDSIPHRVIWKDLNSIYVGCNKAFAEDMGLESTDQIVGKKARDLPLLEKDIKKYEEIQRYVVENNTPLLGHEEKLHKPDGSKAWMRTNVVPLNDKDGKVSGLLITYEDITSQRLTSQQFVESEQRYRMLFENASDAILIADSDFNIIDVNRKACKIFGYSRNQLIEMKTHALQSLEDQTDQVNSHKRFETKTLHPDGREMNVEVSLSPFLLSKRTLFMAVIRDITEHKNSLEQLNAREETVRSIINASVEPMLLLDPEGIILNLNQTAAMMFGVETDELIGKDNYALLTPEAAEIRRRYMGLAISWSMPVSFEEASGGIDFETVIHPVFGKDGQVNRLAVFSRDITVQKNKELWLESSELKYRSAFKHLASAAVLFDGEAGIIREINDQMRRMIGSDSDKIAGMHFSELFCPDFLSICQDLLARATEETNLMESYLATLKNSSGDNMEVVISVRNLWITNNCFLLATIQDKKQLESLLESNPEK